VRGATTFRYVLSVLLVAGVAWVHSVRSTAAAEVCADGEPVGAGCNSLLDVLVSGCAATFLCVPVVFPTQPDVGVDPNPPNVLLADPVTGKVTVVEPDDAYSSTFGFAAIRVHMTNGVLLVFADGFENGSISQWSDSVGSSLRP